MKKKVFLIVGSIIVILAVVGYVTSYKDSARVRAGIEPKYTIKVVSNDGSKVTYWGLGYKVIRYVGVSPNEPFKNNIGAKYGSWFMNYELEKPIPLENIKQIIDNYIDINNIENYIRSYIDEKENAVIVVLKDNDVKKQDEFIYEVFSHTTGSKYIRNIKDYSLTKFKKGELESEQVNYNK